MTNQAWQEQAYPLRQLTIRAQGTRHSSREELISHVERVLTKLKTGHVKGQSHDDDDGYVFELVEESPGPSFFDEPCGEQHS